MGCGKSKPQNTLEPVLPGVTQDTIAPSPISNGDVALTPILNASGKRKTKDMLHKEIENKETQVDNNLKDMFNTAYKRLTVGGEEMTKEKLKDLFDTIDEQTFEDIYCLFDWDGDGSVDAHEFILTMCLLATPATSYEAEQDLLFAIFDNDGSGTIDKEEFGKMMKATLRCKQTHLDFCLKNGERQDTFRQHLEGEYSVEAIDFYQEVEDFRKFCQKFDENEIEFHYQEINKIAFQIYDNYIVQGAPSEVNISGRERVKVEVEIEACRKNNNLVKLNVFDSGQLAIYKLLNQDTFERFRHNDTLLDDMLAKLFREADVDDDGSITVEEYKKWAADNPELTSFLKDLHKSTFAGIAKAAGLQRRKTITNHRRTTQVSLL